MKERGACAAARYHAFLWENANQCTETDNADGSVVGHLNGQHWRAWVTEPDEVIGTPADGSMPLPPPRTTAGAQFALQNSRLHHFRREMATLRRGEEDEAEAEEEEMAEADKEAEGRSIGQPRPFTPPPSPPPPSPPPPSPPPPSPPPPSRPLVTVVLPIFNGEGWLDECLGALLRQTWVSRHGLHRPAATPSTDGAEDCSVGGAYENSQSLDENGNQNSHDCAPPHTASASLAHAGLIELSAFDDGSTDETWARLTKHWAPHLRACGWRVVLGRGAHPPGGYALCQGRLMAFDCV